MNKERDPEMTMSRTILDSLVEGAQGAPSRAAYVYLSGAGEERLTYGELLVAAAAAAQVLTRATSPGDRVLLIGSLGPDFPAHLLGAMASGLIPVPVPPPYLHRDLERLLAIARDSGCRTIMVADRGKDGLAGRIRRRGIAGEFQVVSVAEEAPRPGEAEAIMLLRTRRIDGRAPALLQYTSGSTGRPRGVVLSHDNIMSNQTMIARAFGHSSKTIVAGWLPPYHDMGLIGLVMQPLFLGSECILMSPAEFAKNPFKWLQMISKFRVTTSGGPNFAYDLCVERVDESKLEMLDLGCWRVAFNGSEKVREGTIDRFDRKFSKCGFRREAMLPCYGLAEASLFVSGGPSWRRPVFARLNRLLLQEGCAVESDGSAVSVVSCGLPADGTAVLIVDPDTLQESKPRQVGEVWIRSPSAASGYWGDAEGTTEHFAAFTADGTGPFLRTGDLGFVKENELYITGRLKDTIVIRGRNLFAEDVEATALESSKAFGVSSCAAFSIDGVSQEELVIVGEMQSRNLECLDGAGVVEAIRRSVAEEHGAIVHAIALIEERRVERTSSGKIRRFAYRRMFADRSLQAAWEFRGGQCAGTVD